ncbi:hypothetical protein N7528_006627 [Penicillium herquei]|nr:hypothetical protein N7528_006627 [Penicillium herquei]
MARIKVQGPYFENNADHKKLLKNQLKSISSRMKHLYIDDGPPSDTEWSLLGAKLKKVKDLELDPGLGEDLDDKNIPLHWPLRKLTVYRSAFQLVQSRFIRQGLVSHLILWNTLGLRFEGPTDEEIMRLHDEPTELDTKSQDGPAITDEFFRRKDIVDKYLEKLYADSNRKLEPENEPPAGPIKLKTLEIFEGDPMSTFSRMFMAIPHVMHNLDTLILRSTTGSDLQWTSEELFRQQLPLMENLQELNFTVGEMFKDPQFLPTLYKMLPPNLTSLYFRGPVSLVNSEHWADWLAAFRSSTFLPKLERLSFVLDLHYGKRERGYWGRNGAPWGTKENPAPIAVLEHARQECKVLYEIARGRGIVVECFPPEKIPCYVLRFVDHRW